MIKKHSFAILAFKESPHIQECIDSLRKQTIPSEIFICTSTPNAFLENIAAKNGLRLLVNAESNGIANDWNFALNQTAAKYVTLAHQDDVYFPEYAEEITKAAETRTDTLVIFSDYDEIVGHGAQAFIRKKSLNFFVKRLVLELSFLGKNHLVRNKKRLLAFGSPIGCPTVTFRKDNIGSFQFDGSFSVNMDWKAWHDLAQKEGSFIRVKRPLVSHRIYAGSETSRGLAENRRQKEDMEMFKKFWPAIVAYFLGKIYRLSYKNNNN